MITHVARFDQPIEGRGNVGKWPLRDGAYERVAAQWARAQWRAMVAENYRKCYDSDADRTYYVSKHTGERTYYPKMHW